MRTLRPFALALALLPLAGCALPSSHPTVSGASRALQSFGADAPFSLLIEPDMGMAPVLRAIQGAQKSLLVEMYMFTNHDATAQLTQALIDRAKAGVDVRVLIEPHPFTGGAGNVNGATVQALTAGGVKVKNSNPAFKYTHEKSMVVDGTTAYLMTFNFTNSAFTNNREYAVIDRDPTDVSEVSSIFQADWNQAAYKPVAPNLVVSPDNSRRKLLDLIDSAKQTLVMQCEVIGDQAIADHLGARAKAGVDIRVMLANMAGKQGNGKSTNEAERKQLAAEGITQVAFMKSRVMHAKTIEVDGTRAYIGSENMTSNSLDHNRELGILVQDPTLLSQLDTVLKKDWSQG